MSDRQRPALVWALIVLLIGEFLLAAALAVTLLIELLIATPASFGSAVALTVLAFIAAAWIGAIVIGALRGQAWIRGAAIVWQVLQFAIGASAISGTFSTPAIGWPLVAVAVVAFVLLFAKPVVDATSRREERAG
ncbi:MAG TPA: hypothetical protein VF479_05210 [Pseudolysinimonas sp.]